MTRKSFLGIALLGAFLTSSIQAVPIITQAGTDLGFTLTTVITNTPNSFPVGIAVNSVGNIVFYNYSGGVTSVISDVDNQNYLTPGTVLSTANNAVGVPGMAYANGSVWMGGNSLRRLNNDGSTAQNFSNIPVGWGMWTNQATGHIIAFINSTSSIADIDVSDPNNPTYTIIKTGTSGDGLTVSPDGTTIYTSAGQIIDLTNPAAPIGHFTPPSGADGMGVISSSNQLNGKIIVNTTVGQIVMLDPLNNYAQTIIATGGGYGDFTGPDWTNGTLLVPSGNAIMRLSCGEGCGIGVAPPPPSGDVPEPATSGLMAAALAGLAMLKRRMRK